MTTQIFSSELPKVVGSKLMSMMGANQSTDVSGASQRQSLPVSVDDQIMPTSESEDTLMPDQPLPEEATRGPAIDEASDIQLVSKDEFDKPQPNHERKLIQNLRGVSKRLKKSVMKQRITIAELRAQSDINEEDLTEALRISHAWEQDAKRSDIELEVVKAQLATTKQELQASKNTRSRTRGTIKDWANLQKDLADMERQFKESQEVVHQLQTVGDDLQELRTKLVASQRELSACKDDLFRLQPVAQVPDSSISKEFDAICQHIIHWIDAEVTGFEKAHPETEPEHIFSVGDDMEAATFLGKHPGAGEHLARHLVHRYLLENMFHGKVYFFGLPTETAQLLQKAEQGMANLKTPRDPVTIASWRSETLTVMMNIPECVRIRTNQIQGMNERLFRDLSKTFPILFTRRETMTKFCHEVLIPAARLALKIKASAAIYRWTEPHSPLTNFKPLKPEHLKIWKMIDIKTEKWLKPDSAVVADRQGIIGDFIVGLEPGLYRIKRDKQEAVLRQPTYLVDLRHPVGKRNRGSD